MSSKRILGITAFGVLLIVAVIGVMLLVTYFRHESGVVNLPETVVTAEIPDGTEPDTLDRVEVTPGTVQAVVSTLVRPDVYSRIIKVESFWDDGQVSYTIHVAVYSGFTSIRTVMPAGGEKYVIVTPDTLYIWYADDVSFFIGERGTLGDDYRIADEFQMIDAYEDILDLDRDCITNAGYTVYRDDDCIYIEYLSPFFGYLRKYYVSIGLGLVIAVEEYDETGRLVYSMTAGECLVGEVDPAAFTLPDGTNVLD